MVGIDVGGTTVKGVLVDADGNIYAKNETDSCRSGGCDLTDKIVGLIELLLSSTTDSRGKISGVGIGCPGIIDGRGGMVVFAGNLNLRNYPLADAVRGKTGVPVRLTNDANAAAFGEKIFGVGKNYKDVVMITLGTGVGSGIVIDGKLYEGSRTSGAELGHMTIVEDGRRCSCGRRGCFETYASATALMSDVRSAMFANRNSLLWKKVDPEKVDCRVVFDLAEADNTAKNVVDDYIRHVACGITNIANIFRPEAVIIGGGISGQGDRLVKPLQNYLDCNILGGNKYAPVKILAATLKNGAGALGAAALFL